MEFIDDLIKQSAEIVPNVSDNLKDSILEEYEIRKDKKPKFFNRKVMTMGLSFMSVILALLVFIPLLIQNASKKTGDINTRTEYCSVASSSKFGIKKGGTDSAIEYYSIAGGIVKKYSYSESIYKSEAIDSDYSKGDSDPKSSIDEEITINALTSGILTSSVISDNENYTYFNSLITKGQEETGLFYEYQNKYNLTVKNRIVVTANKGLSAKVSLIDENQKVIYSSNLDNFGKAYLFYEYKKDYTVVVEGSSYKYTYNNINSDLDLTGSLNELTNNKVNKIELMFVIDATGSMSDEINYLKAEINDVISRIKENNDNVEISLAMMVYRDMDDEYVTRYSDFTSDITAQQKFLSDQNASGGGDFEEAVTVALDEALSKNWSNSDSTKILVHVADAPAHEEDVSKWNELSKDFSKKGIKIVTVASSGINKETEYLMRAEALMTGGYYGYLTDDSGIGGSHVEATTEEKPVVEHLNLMLVRIISGIYNGSFEEPVSYEENYYGVIVESSVENIEIVKNVLNTIKTPYGLLYKDDKICDFLVDVEDIETVKNEFANVDIKVTIEKNFLYSLDSLKKESNAFKDDSTKRIDIYGED